MFFGDLWGVTHSARQAYTQLCAQAKGAVVPPLRHRGCERQINPLRELRRQQAPHQRDVDMNLVWMHLARGHAALL
jgi:hypothetical protein